MSSKLEKLLEKQGISETEAIAAIKGARSKPGLSRHIPDRTQHTKYLYISDEHIGHKQFKEDLFMKAVHYAKKEAVDFIVNPGDHLEGMSHRPGHVYELNRIGFNNQINYAAQLYNEFGGIPHYGIDGNHDQWYFKPQNMGVVVGKELEARVKGFVNLGQDEGDITVGNGLKIKLFHPNDGTAYATSYKIQKLVESFGGGEKPNILHSGHYHKAMYAFVRNVHAFESGTLCGQSSFMRGKKIPAHMGFGIVDVRYNKTGVTELTHKFIPGYD
jgi:predicted phosphodiesterase